MDHKVSKDMISSGMIPSGEKTQADLGRTQYGSAPSPSKLMDAYKSMYEHHKKDADGNTIPHEDEEVSEGKIPAGLQAYLDKKKGKKEDKKDMKEQYDLVYEHFIGEGFSEEETYERMSNLTEEQLDEFMKALATRAAQYGANLGKPASQKINVVNPPSSPRKPFDAKRKPFDAKKPEPKPGDSGFKAKSASDVVNAAAAIRKNRMIKDMEPKKGEVMQDEYQHQIDEVAFLAPALGKVAAIAAKGAAMAGKAGKVATTVGKVSAAGAKKLAKSSLASDMARGAAMQAGSNIVSGGGGGGQQKQRTGTVSASADLFDIVKGQLLDEGLSEEEIRDIMLTLTPDEIMKEMNQGPSTPVSIDDVEFPKPGKKVMPKTGATYIGKVRPKPGFKMNPSTAQLEKEEYKGSGTPEQQAAMKAQVEVSKKVNRYGGKTPSGTTAVDAKKGIEDVRKSM